MSDIAATITAGYGHPNSGLPSMALVTGTLYVGGSGRWHFGPASVPPGAPTGARSLSLASDGHDIATEARAGIALCLGIPEALAVLPPAAARRWNTSGWVDLDLPTGTLAAMAIAGRGRGLSVVVTVPEVSFLLDQWLRAADDDGWSTVVCGPLAGRLESQWGIAPAQVV